MTFLRCMPIDSVVYMELYLKLIKLKHARMLQSISFNAKNPV